MNLTRFLDLRNYTFGNTYFTDETRHKEEMMMMDYFSDQTPWSSTQNVHYTTCEAHTKNMIDAS